ncbi:MAG: diguanylate cyclase [Spirochaetota bacterium]
MKPQNETIIPAKTFAMMSKPGLSPPLLLTIMVPFLAGLLLFALVLFSFEAGHRVAVEVNERNIEELVEVAGSSIEELWIAPRSETVVALSRSDTLRRRLNGDVSFEELADEWEVAQQVLEGYFSIYYGLEDGTIEHYPRDSLPDDYDPRERPWYELGMQSEGEPRWTSPYEEIRTGETVVSTVAPIPADYIDQDSGSGTAEDGPAGVISTDMSFAPLKESLENIELPTGGSVFIVDQDGNPFVGTDEEVVQQEELPESTEDLYVDSSSLLSSGWRVSVIVPRESLAENFAELRRPIIIVSAVLLVLVTVVLSILVARVASRAHHLAAYFREAVEESQPLRELFRSRDEFSYLNRRFNKVVHDARLAEEEKLARERTFRFLVEQAPVGFFRSHADGSLLYLNAHCAAMLGYAREEAYERIFSVRELYDDETDRDRFLEELRRDGEVRNRKIRFIKKSGERIWVSMTARIDPEVEAAGAFRIEGFLIDITEDMEERQNLVTLAESDPLTGAWNRRAFDGAAQEVARHAWATGQSVGVVTFDIDEFKPINDTHGHDVGDAILRHVVSVAKHVVRERDVFARLGGDEFAILLPESGEDAAFRLAERLIEQVETTPLPEGITIRPTLSLGVAALNGVEVYVPELMKAADTAMYHAKRLGGNQVARASEITDSDNA